MTNRKYYSHDAQQTVQMEKALLGLSTLVAGIGIGSAIALLFAPEEGDKIRHRLAEALETSSEKSQEKLAELIHSLEAEYPDFSERVSQAVDSMKKQTEKAIPS